MDDDQIQKNQENIDQIIDCEQKTNDINDVGNESGESEGEEGEEEME